MRLLGAPTSLPSAVGRRQPLSAWALVTIYVGLLLLIPARLVFPGLGGAGRPAVAFGLGLLVWWLASRLHPHLVARGSQPVRWVVLALVLTTLLSYALAFDRGLLPLEVRSADRHLIKLGSQLGVALVVADGLRSRSEIQKVVAAVVALSGFSALVGLLQFYGFDLAPFLRVPGLVYNQELVGLGQRGGPGFARVYGTQQHYIEFSVVLAMVLPLGVHQALAQRGQSRTWVRWGLVALLAAAIPLSISRSGVLGVAVGFLVLSAVWPRRMRRRAYVIVLVGLVAYRGAVPGVLGTIKSAFLNQENDPSILNRRADYAATSSYIADRPWFGRGPGTFVPEIYRVLDNQMLLTLLEVGVVGTAAIAALFLAPVALGRSVRLRAALDSDRHLGQALAASAAVGLVSSLTFDSLAFPTFPGIAYFVLGLSGALYRCSRQTGEAQPMSGARQLTGQRFNLLSRLPPGLESHGSR